MPKIVAPMDSQHWNSPDCMYFSRSGISDSFESNAAMGSALGVLEARDEKALGEEEGDEGKEEGVCVLKAVCSCACAVCPVEIEREGEGKFEGWNKKCSKNPRAAVLVDLCQTLLRTRILASMAVEGCVSSRLNFEDLADVLHYSLFS